MKRTNKEKNSIILGFVSSIIIFIIGVFYIINYIVSPILDIENKKADVLDIQNKIKSITIKGLPYDLFKELSTDLNGNNDIQNSSYLEKLLLKTDEEFYNKNFINTGSISYKQFLKEKDIEINKALEKTSLGLEKYINKILPSYNNSLMSYGDGNSLTDFKFINYLEELFNNFNLEYTGDLGIKSLENYYKGEDDLDTSIFYIALDFNLTGKKKDIINFIHYFENVGYIKIIGNQLKLQKDYFIPNNILFSGDEQSNYNIYNHQLADISYIKIPEYLDSSYKPRDKSTDFISFIKNDVDQNNEKIKINLGIQFYTRGMANYEIKKRINLILANFDGLSKSITQKLRDPKRVNSKNNKDILFINKLKKLNTTISGFKKDIALIKKNINRKGENLNELYKQALKYDKIIDRSLTLMGETIYTKIK